MLNSGAGDSEGGDRVNDGISISSLSTTFSRSLDLSLHTVQIMIMMMVKNDVCTVILTEKHTQEENIETCE